MALLDNDFGSFNAGRHLRLWELLGARVVEVGCVFRVWAPNARNVAVRGDWSRWSGRWQMHRVGDTGVWEAWVEQAIPGQRYKYEIEDCNGWVTLRADPMARATEIPPDNASVICGASRYQWGDEAWTTRRRELNDRRLRIYEVHLGSWRFDLHNYREVAHALAGHVKHLGFTHVELLPVSEFPYGPSWGYQVTGYFAPTARYGTTDDFRAFVDILHQHDIGVIVDWVPAHFPRDSWALARFDGTALYEHFDPRRGEQPDWGTLVFDFGRPEVRNFLVASAMHWLDEYHVDGLRVDAVASMLYLDYSRGPGGWAPNIFGGRENLEAIDFFRHLNGTIAWQYPGTMVIAEESTAFPGVTHAPADGGLGFTHKWNMGWMNDTLSYLAKAPVHRQWHHHQLTFGLMYAFSERFVLPLSHDEVVHGKGSLYGKIPGDHWQKMATLRTLYAWMWALPGSPLLFMGAELGMSAEWNENDGLPWHLLQFPLHDGINQLIGRLSAVSDTWPAMWERDDDPGGFTWLDADDEKHSTYAFIRWATARLHAVVCVANFTPSPRDGYRVGVPWGGVWDVVVDTDAAAWAGSNYRDQDQVYLAGDAPAQGQAHSIIIDIPPLAMVWLAAHLPPETADEGAASGGSALDQPAKAAQVAPPDQRKKRARRKPGTKPAG